jgi:hypothetical protein
MDNGLVTTLDTLRPFSIPLLGLGLFTIFGGGLEILYGYQLSSFYVTVSRPYGTYYRPPLNVAGEAWTILGLVGILTGGLFAVSGVISAVRSFLVWSFGLAVYVTLVILSIWQTNYYGATPAYGEVVDPVLGLFGAFVGVCVIIFLMTRATRSLFSFPRNPLRAGTPKE